MRIFKSTGAVRLQDIAVCIYPAPKREFALPAID
jgi:hypothetical protein